MPLGAGRRRATAAGTTVTVTVMCPNGVARVVIREENVHLIIEGLTISDLYRQPYISFVGPKP